MIIVFPILLYERTARTNSYHNSTNITHTHRPKRAATTMHHHHNHSSLLDNTWYKMADYAAARCNMTNCYVCTFLPLHAHHNPALVAEPADVKTTISMLAFYTRSDFNYTNHTWVQARKPPPNTHWRLPWNFYHLTNDTNLSGLALARFPKDPIMCFTRHCLPHDTMLGRNTGCKYTVPACSNISGSTTENITHVSFNGSTVPCNAQQGTWMNWNMTALSPNSVWNEFNCTLLIRHPSAVGAGTSTNFVWQCGSKTYLYLPSGWCGTCHLARVTPAYKIIPAIPYTQSSHCLRRTADPPRAPLISDVKGILGTIFLPYGAANNAHRINDMYASLEDLTDLVLSLANQLKDDPEREAMRAMLLQDRMVLDLLNKGECVRLWVNTVVHLFLRIGEITLLSLKASAACARAFVPVKTPQEVFLPGIHFPGSLLGPSGKFC